MIPSFLQEALSAPTVILSQMGPHGGEGEGQIFARKIDDIRIARRTFWLHGSSYGMPNHVQQLASDSAALYVLFITPSGRADDMRDPLDPYVCSEYSLDKSVWTALPRTITPVTGSKRNSRRYALVLDSLDWFPATSHRTPIDLWDYARYFAQDEPILGGRGTSTVCAIRKDMRGCPNRIKSNLRAVVGVGRLAGDSSVWLR